MISYADAKFNLEKRGFDTRYFTEEFYKTFINERREALRFKGIEKLKDTRASEFYTLTNDSYCEFMEIFNAVLPAYLFRFYNGGDIKREVIGSYDNVAEARAVANAIEESTGYILEVEKL